MTFITIHPDDPQDARAYDFDKGDRRFSSLQRALEHANERASATGRRQSVREDPGSYAFQKLYLVQDSDVTEAPTYDPEHRPKGLQERFKVGQVVESTLSGRRYHVTEVSPALLSGERVIRDDLDGFVTSGLACGLNPDLMRVVD